MGTKLRSRSEAEVNLDRRPNRKEITFVEPIGRELRSQTQSEGNLDLRPSRKDFTIADRVGRTSRSQTDRKESTLRSQTK